MKKPSFMSKLMFQDFPNEYTVKTYLGSKVLIVSRYEIKVVVLREDNVFLNLSPVDLQASKEEIAEKNNKVYEFCEDFNNKNKPKRAKKAKEIPQLSPESLSHITNRVRIDTETWVNIERRYNDSNE